jgi:hypothetical protein
LAVSDWPLAKTNTAVVAIKNGGGDGGDGFLPCVVRLKPLPEREKGAEAHYKAGEFGENSKMICRRKFANGRLAVSD